MRFVIADVVTFPQEFAPGVLYWSKEFEMSAHACACGCGDVIQLPVDPLNFTITEMPGGPTLRPSVGNWGVCDAHYYITNGGIEWLPKLSAAHVRASRLREDARREAHYSTSDIPRRLTFAQWLKQLWTKIWN